ncbi:MAG: DUF1543 domain-containing protein [Elusimicrobia bacterium]|nr:DUF1543 domain-containing protein [Elusimicrobiota bacterium]
MTAPKLYLVHCGFYDREVFDGVYESHVNLFVAAESFEDARAAAKLDPVFKGRRMHVDGLQQIDAVNGFRVELRPDPELGGATLATSRRHGDLAPKQPA